MCIERIKAYGYASDLKNELVEEVFCAIIHPPVEISFTVCNTHEITFDLRQITAGAINLLIKLNYNEPKGNKFVVNF